MSPTPMMTVNLSVDTYQQLVKLRDAWNEHFYDGKNYLGVNSAVVLLLMHYCHMDDSEKPPTLEEFEKWLERLPKRGRPRLKHPKPRSRPVNPLAWDEMGK